MLRSLARLFLVAATVGCAAKSDESAKVPLGQAPAASTESGAPLTGPIVEQLAASPYVYLRIKTASKGDVWAAVPETRVSNGDIVTLFSPMLMTKFESKSLNRTFDEVYFGSLTAPANAATGAPTGAASNGPAASPHAGTSIPVPSANVGKVDKAPGSEGRTVAEVWSQKSSLAGRTARSTSAMASLAGRLTT